MRTVGRQHQPLLAMGPPRPVPLWWRLAKGYLVLLQLLHPHPIKADHTYLTWSNPPHTHTHVVGQRQVVR